MRTDTKKELADDGAGKHQAAAHWYPILDTGTEIEA
jgi:hypothetical protein